MFTCLEVPDDGKTQELPWGMAFSFFGNIDPSFVSKVWPKRSLGSEIVHSFEYHIGYFVTI